MNKNILKWGFLAILVLVTVYLTVFYDGLSSPGTKKQDFQFNDLERTDSIVISSRKNKASIVAQGDSWEVNGSRINGKRFVLLLETLKNLHSVSPISRSESSEWQTKLEKEAINIRAYSGKRIIYNFSFLSEQDKNIGYMEETGILNRIAIKGFEGVPLKDLISAQPAFWQANILFNLAPEDIADISIVYVKEPANSFRLAIDNPTNFRLINFLGKQETENLDSIKIYNYLQFFSSIQFEEPDTLMYQIPPNPNELLFTFRTSNTKDKIIQIDGYALQSRQTGEINLEKFCAVIGNKNIIILNYNDFDPILAEQSYFLKD